MCERAARLACAARSLPARRGHLRSRRAARARSRRASRCARATSPRAPWVRACASCSARPRTRHRKATSRCTWWCAIRAGARAPPRARPARIRCRRPPRARSAWARSRSRSGGEIALHGGANPLLLGKPVSLGCARATDQDLLRAARLARAAARAPAPRRDRGRRAAPVLPPPRARLGPVAAPRRAAAPAPPPGAPRAGQPPARAAVLTPLAGCSPLIGHEESALALAAACVLAPLPRRRARRARVSFTVFWDRADFGRRRGLGVSQATASSATAAGIPIVQLAGPPSLVPATLPSDLEIDPTLDRSLATVGATPATITSNWTVANDTGTTSLQNLYLVFLQPEPAIIWTARRSPSPTTRPMSGSRSAGGRLGDPPGSMTETRFPCTTPPSRWATWPTARTLHSRSSTRSTIPRCSARPFNFELGMPKWNLVLRPTPIPEPSSGLLVLLGLLGIAGGRRKRS